MSNIQLQTLFQYIAAVTLAVGFVLLYPTIAWGFFSGVQTAPEQQFAAAHLALLPAENATTTVQDGASSVPTQTVLGVTQSSVESTYDLTVRSTSGSQNLCDTLTLESQSPSGNEVAMPLNDYVSGTESETGQWELTVQATDVPLALPDGSYCSVLVEVDAWQHNMSKGTGFVDTTTFVLTVLLQAAEEEEDDEEEEEDEQEEDDKEDEENGSSGPGLGDIVINEIMWMGSSVHYNDQWIELRNTTDDDIDVGQWIVENGEASNQNLMLPANSVIPANDLFVLYRRNPQSPNSAVDNDLPNSQIRQSGSLSLANDYDNNGALVLSTPDGTLIDQTPEPTSSSWPHGENDPGQKRWSMQRGAVPGDGTDLNHWYTCNPDVLDGDGTLAQMQGYWKSGTDSNCGTPGRVNLSSNDPTKPGYIRPSTLGTGTESDDTTSAQDDVGEESAKGEDEDEDSENIPDPKDEIDKRKEDGVDVDDGTEKSEQTEESNEESDTPDDQKDDDDSHEQDGQALREEDAKGNEDMFDDMDSTTETDQMDAPKDVPEDTDEDGDESDFDSDASTPEDKTAVDDSDGTGSPEPTIADGDTDNI